MIDFINTVLTPLSTVSLFLVMVLPTFLLLGRILKKTVTTTAERQIRHNAEEVSKLVKEVSSTRPLKCLACGHPRVSAYCACCGAKQSKMVETVVVKSVAYDGNVRINKSDFNPQLHERVED